MAGHLLHSFDYRWQELTIFGAQMMTEAVQKSPLSERVSVAGIVGEWDSLNGRPFVWQIRVQT